MFLKKNNKSSDYLTAKQSFFSYKNTNELRSIVLAQLWHKAVSKKCFPKWVYSFLQHYQFLQPLLQVQQITRRIKLLGKRLKKYSLLFSISYDPSSVTKNLIYIIKHFWRLLVIETCSNKPC